MPEAVIEAIPEVTAVIENVALPMQMQSLKVLLEESHFVQKQKAMQNSRQSHIFL